MDTGPGQLLGSESTLRLAAFVGILAATVTWELLLPHHAKRESVARHGLRNLIVLVVGTVLVRVLVPVLPVGLAQVAEGRGWGLLNQLSLPGWVAILGTVVLLDLAIYLQHVVLHAVPVLWRLHMVHHTDLDFDATTGVRFHPLEILLSTGYKLALVLALGPPAVGVMLFEILLSGTSLFNHANARLPPALDRVLRWVLVTPDMHRVHHSADKPETNSNYGFNLPWWDRLFGTYTDQPAAGHDEMTIGLEHYRDPSRLRLFRLLLLPFQGKVGKYPRRGG